MLPLKWQEGRQPRGLLCFSAAFFLMALTVTLLFVRVESLSTLFLLTAMFGCLYSAVAVIILQKFWLFKSLFAGLLVGCLWCCGYLLLCWNPAQQWDNESGAIRLEVDAYAEAKVSYGVVYGRVTHVNDVPCGHKAKVYLRDGSPEFAPGDVLFFEGTLSAVRRELDSNLLQQGCFLIAAQESPATLQPGACMDFPRRAAVFSKRLSDSVTELLPGDEGALLAALLSGQRDGFSDGFDRALTTSGTRHITAVSGLHVTTLAGILLWVFGKRLGLVLAVPVGVIYAAVTGFSPSVIRAVILLMFWAASFWLKQEKDSLTALAAALLLLVACNPFCCVSAGLLLSFAATLGLILLSAPIHEVLSRPVKGIRNRWCGKLLHYLTSTTAATLSATVFTLPLNLLFFDAVPLLSVLSNLLVLWALSTILVLGIVVLAAAWLWMPGAELLARWVLYWPLTWVVRVIRTVGSWRFAATDSANLILAAACVLLLMAVLLWRGNLLSGKRLLVCCAVMLCAVTVFTTAERMLFGLLEIHNYGGQPVLLMRAEGMSMINAGAQPDRAADAVTNGLSRWNADGLDTLLCTSGNYRTQGGLPAVAAATDIHRLLLPSDDSTVPAAYGGAETRVFSDSGTVTVSGVAVQLLRGGEELYAVRLLKDRFSLLSLCGLKPANALALTETFVCQAGILMVDDTLANDWQTLYDLCQRVCPEQILVITGGHCEHGDSFAGIPLTIVDREAQRFRFVR